MISTAGCHIPQTGKYLRVHLVVVKARQIFDNRIVCDFFYSLSISLSLQIPFYPVPNSILLWILKFYEPHRNDSCFNERKIKR